jgi:hypothetical protein
MFKRLSTAAATVLLLSMSSLAAEQGKFSGQIFFDYHHDFTSPQSGRVSAPGQENSFQFNRIYFGYDRDINETFSIRFTLDANFDKEYQLQQTGTLKVVDTSGDTVLVPTYTLQESGKAFRPFVKYAYLAVNCKLIPGSKWYLGMISMPFVNIPQNQQWGYRVIAKGAMNIQGWGYTADMGVGWKGMWNDQYLVEFALTNGSGFRNPELDMFKVMELRGTAYLLKKQLIVSAFGSYEQLTRDVNAMIAEAMVGFDHKKFRVGAEYARRMFSEAYFYANGKSAEAQYLYSFWLHLKPHEMVTLLGRYDHYDPNPDMDHDGSSLWIAGVDFHPIKNVRIIPNVQINSFESEDNPSTAADESASVNTFYLSLEVNW